MSTRINEYVFIRLWGNQLGSYAGYIQQQVNKAKSEDAPKTALYKRQDNTWACIEDIENKPLARELILKAIQ